MAFINKELFMNKLAEFIGKTNKDIADLKAVTDNKELWTGSMLLTESQTANLSELVSNQQNGIVLVWSRCEDGEPKNWGWIHNFIPKWQVKNYDGTGINCPLTGFSKCGGSIYKYIYLYDNKITGHAQNYTDAYAKKFCLRAVLGV